MNKRNLFFDVNLRRILDIPFSPTLTSSALLLTPSIALYTELPASLVALSIDVKSLTIMSCGELGGALTTIPEANHRRFNARAPRR